MGAILGQVFILHLCITVFDSKESVLSCVHIMMFCCLLNLGVLHYITIITINILYKCNCCRGGRRPRED